MIRVCFVCLGNICRSPTAEGVMQKLVSDARLGHAIEVASAGTAAYHVGERSDPRSREEASRRGVKLESRACQFNAIDFCRFDYVLAMDSENLDNLRSLSEDPNDHAKLSLLRSFETTKSRSRDVPDPYYGGEDGFERVFDICEAACKGLLLHITTDHDLVDR
ncbi:MAG: low molecular weight phosphotyrosine protein phosphatase [Deltaproteobacteria bacterium]|nr:low molecular weight phosphotyrosine protein phosphatase [Deltaproteobacteria bacterium]MBW2725745.1 low molecular weight phosphotyrosine protein phosphatase [Deltaproteobacteria bacterium]